MGTFSKLHRFHKAGDDPNVNNVAAFGRPVHSLYTSTRVFTLHHHIDITDDDDRVVYEANSKMISLHDKTDITDASGSFVAHIERKFFSIHERHFIYMDDGLSFELSNEIFHIIRDITNIEGLGWQLRGNILGLNFELYDAYGQIVAVIGQKMLSIHDKYCMDIYQADKEKIVVAIVIALQHMIRDRESSSSGGGGSSGN